jgi:hypothetical protein
MAALSRLAALIDAGELRSMSKRLSWREARLAQGMLKDGAPQPGKIALVHGVLRLKLLTKR